MKKILLFLFLIAGWELYAQQDVLAGGQKAFAIFYAESYGIRPDGTDQTSKIQALLDTVYNRGGGHIKFSPGTYLINGRIKPKVLYNGINTPSAPDFVIEGAGAFNSGNYITPTGGTIFDCRYSGDTIGVFQFRGSGKTEISRVTFKKSVPGLESTPFVHTTFRTLHIHDCAFIGFSSVSRCAGIILGGDVAYEGVSPADTSFYNGFQGYGTVIESNFFNFINTGIKFKTYANAVVVTNNNFWNGCGGFAAITLTPSAAVCAGNVISNNLIEMTGYQYGIVLGRAATNSIINNNFFDVSGTTKANVRVFNNSYNNLYVSAMKGGVVDDLYDPFGVVTCISAVGGDTTVIPGYWKHTTTSDVLMQTKGEKVFGSTDHMFAQIKETNPYGYDIYYSRLGAAATKLVGFNDYGSNTKEIQIAVGSSGTGRIQSEGNLRIFSKSGGETYLGAADNQNHLFLNGVFYGGLTTTNTPFKVGQSDKILWGDTSNPLSGDGAGFTSSAINVMRTINAAGTDGRHQASEFYATGTGANQIPVGNTAARPTGQRGYIRNNLQTGKFEGVRVGSSYETFFTLQDTLSASPNQVLTWNGSSWAPATNTSESTKIGTFSTATDPKGLTISGDSIKLMSASLTRPGGINLIAQAFQAGAGAKLFQSTGTASIAIDNAADTGEAGINFTQLSGADIMAQMSVNSTDASNARFQLLIEDDGAYVNYQTIGTENDEKGVFQSGGMYEDAPKNITSTTYTLQYGDRNLLLNATDMVFTLQEIGTGAGQTKPGRVVWLFNDNTTSVTVTAAAGQNVIDANTLSLSGNTAIALIAAPTGKWLKKG